MAGYQTPAWSDMNSPAMSAGNLAALGQAAELGEHPYGVCTTAATTADKTVTIDYSGTLTLFTGLTVHIKFSYQNTAANPTLNVNGTGAKPIVCGSESTVQCSWVGGTVVTLTYDGTNWVIDQRLPYKSFLDMAADNTLANLIDSLDANNASIPIGASVIRVGNTTNPSRVILLVLKVTTSLGIAITLSPYTALNNVTLNLTSGGWTT